MTDRTELRRLEATARLVDRGVEGVAAAHQRLLRDLDALTDDDARRPSQLPGWTVGHVLTHVARNGDGLRRMIEGAERGEVAHMYDSGGARNRDIEVGSSRSIAELADDVRRSAWQLEQVWATARRAWTGSGMTMRGERAITDVPLMRWREVVVHHTDLGIGYAPADWPTDYVDIEQDPFSAQWTARHGEAELPEAVRALAPHLQLAWMLGRVEVPGVPAADLMG